MISSSRKYCLFICGLVILLSSGIAMARPTLFPAQSDALALSLTPQGSHISVQTRAHQLASTQLAQIHYGNKVRRYAGMRRAGIGMIIGGSVGQVSGIILVSLGLAEMLSLNVLGGAWTYYVGILFASVGTLVIAGGITLMIIGGIKRGKYERMYRAYSRIQPTGGYDPISKTVTAGMRVTF